MIGFISLLHLPVVGIVDLPIIRKAGLRASLEEVAGEASFDRGFSAMIRALLQATSSWSKSHKQLSPRPLAEKLLGRSNVK